MAGTAHTNLDRLFIGLLLHDEIPLAVYSKLFILKISFTYIYYTDFGEKGKGDWWISSGFLMNFLHEYVILAQTNTRR